MMAEKLYDVIVVGGGHAGCEAASASARTGAATLLVTHHVATIGEMSCNPAIGGVGKGHLVREIDALDGIMGQAADRAGIQFRMLNLSKGPAVHGPRTQADRMLYKQAVQHLLAQQPHLTIGEGAVEDFLIQNHKVTGVIFADGSIIKSKTVILTTGTFLSGMIHIGDKTIPAGRIGEKACTGLAKRLSDYDFPLGRLKTGTPPRLRASTIQWHGLQEQKPDTHPVPFSFMTETLPNPQISCYLTHTNEQTHEIISDNISRSSIYSGQITSIGPRYCPSIEDKITRFKERKSHQIFLEPEGLESDIIYPNGISTALPEQVQADYIHSIVGLEQCEIVQYGYAIEYDFIDPRTLHPHLESKNLENLFLAGQINGTTGYEEAAGQGIIAGINAARKAAQKSPLILSRTNAYIGVMIDDLTKNGTQEPYRMFTSRAEYRLWLRADNAEERLHDFGIEADIISEQRKQKWQNFYQTLQQARKLLSQHKASPTLVEKTGITVNQDGKKRSLMEWLALPQVTWEKLIAVSHLLMEKTKQDIALKGFSQNIIKKLEIDALYSGYLSRQTQDIEIYQRDKALSLPSDLDFTTIGGLSKELQQKLTQQRPQSLADASSIAGMTPAALLLLLRYVKKNNSKDSVVPAA